MTTKRLTVYRIELPDGKGLYRTGGYAYSILQSSQLHPLPNVDAKLGPNWDSLAGSVRYKYYFGFSSLYQLKRWVFTKQSREAIDAEGFVVSVFKAEGYDGDTQCCYHNDTREDTLETMRLTEI